MVMGDRISTGSRHVDNRANTADISGAQKKSEPTGARDEPAAAIHWGDSAAKQRHQAPTDP